jgi:tRNA (guanine37-N1)-methyltransferase
MRFEIVTIFPGFFEGIFENGILRRALAEGLVTVGVHDLRTFTHDRHRTVDDRPFGGGEGMVLKAEPLAEALASLGIKPKTERESEDDAAAGTRVILLSAQGRRFMQAMARELLRHGTLDWGLRAERRRVGRSRGGGRCDAADSGSAG